jgi:valyl-tRNA synthetase
MEYLQGVIRAMRNLRAEIKLPPQKMTPSMSLRPKEEDKAALVGDNRDMVTLMAKVENVELGAFGSPKPRLSIATVTGDWELFFPVGDLMDVEREITRLRDELDKLEAEMKRVRGKLDNENFIRKAPQEVVEKERAALEQGESRKQRIRENIDGLR